MSANNSTGVGAGLTPLEIYREAAKMLADCLANLDETVKERRAIDFKLAVAEQLSVEMAEIRDELLNVRRVGVQRDPMASQERSARDSQSTSDTLMNSTASDDNDFSGQSTSEDVRPAQKNRRGGEKATGDDEAKKKRKRK